MASPATLDSFSASGGGTGVVRRERLSSAVGALLDHLHARSEQRKPQLLGGDEADFLYLVLTLHRIPAASRLNPHLLPLPHPLYPSSSAADDAPSLCLLLDDRPTSSSPNAAAVLGRAAALSLPIDEVIPLSSLRADYVPFEARRKLCASHDLFLADRRILPLLPRLLGKHFFRKKKIPLAVDLSRPGWPEQVRRCLTSGPLYIRSGTCCAVRIGRMAMSPEAVVDNAVAVLKEAMEQVPRQWANLRSVHVKAVDSVALPVYQAVPEMGLKITIAPREKEGEVIDAASDKPEESRKKNLDTKKKKKKMMMKKSLGRIHELMQKIEDDKDDEADTAEEGEGSDELRDCGAVMHGEDHNNEDDEPAKEDEPGEIVIKKRKKGDVKKQQLAERGKNKKSKKNPLNEVYDDDVENEKDHNAQGVGTEDDGLIVDAAEIKGKTSKRKKNELKKETGKQGKKVSSLLLAEVPIATDGEKKKNNKKIAKSKRVK